MAQPHPILLSTRLRIASAIVVTILVFVQNIRRLELGHPTSGWLLGPPLFHGWVLVGVNVLIYAYLGWLAVWLIHGTTGRERIFMLGWLMGILLSPIKMLRPEWSNIVGYIALFGLMLAGFAALALLLEGFENTREH